MSKRTFEIESSMGMKGVYVFHNSLEKPREFEDPLYKNTQKKSHPIVTTIDQFVDFLKTLAYGGYELRGGADNYGHKDVTGGTRIPSLKPKVEPTSQGNPDLAVTTTKSLDGKRFTEHMNIRCLETGEEASYIFTYTFRKPMGKPKGKKRLI